MTVQNCDLAADWLCFMLLKWLICQLPQPALTSPSAGVDPVCLNNSVTDRSIIASFQAKMMTSFYSSRKESDCSPQKMTHNKNSSPDLRTISYRDQTGRWITALEHLDGDSDEVFPASTVDVGEVAAAQLLLQRELLLRELPLVLGTRIHDRGHRLFLREETHKYSEWIISIHTGRITCTHSVQILTECSRFVPQNPKNIQFQKVNLRTNLQNS